MCLSVKSMASAHTNLTILTVVVTFSFFFSAPDGKLYVNFTKTNLDLWALE